MGDFFNIRYTRRPALQFSTPSAPPTRFISLSSTPRLATALVLYRKSFSAPSTTTMKSGTEALDIMACLFRGVPRFLGLSLGLSLWFSWAL